MKGEQGRSSKRNWTGIAIAVDEIDELTRAIIEV